MRNQKGFTLIELVVVIVILGILAAVAVPKFVDLQEDAKKSAVKGAAAALSSEVSLVKAKWLVGGDSTATTVDVDEDGTDDFTVTISGGWITGDGTSAAGDDDGCNSLWNAALDDNSMRAATANADFSGSFAAGPICTYTYTGSSYTIVYDSNDGTVTTSL